MEAAQHDHAIAVANPAVTWRAVNVVASLAAQQVGPGNRKRKNIDFLIAHFAGVPRAIDAQVPTRDGSLHFRPGRAPVSEKVRSRKWLIARLIVHVLPATR